MGHATTISLEPAVPSVIDWLLRRILGDWPDPDQAQRLERTRRVVATAHEMIPEIERVAAMRASYRRAGHRLSDRRDR